MVGTGDRNENIRTYNFPTIAPDRPSHRRCTAHHLPYVMEGNIDEIVNGLVTHHQAELLKQENIT